MTVYGKSLRKISKNKVRLATERAATQITLDRAIAGIWGPGIWGTESEHSFIFIFISTSTKS